eukprot:1138172-Pelagomonas_calceolata.AAC.2
MASEIVEIHVVSQDLHSFMACAASLIHCNSRLLLKVFHADISLFPYILPKYLYLDLPKHVVRSVARFCLRVHTLKVERASWDDTNSPACDLCDAHYDVQDE